MKERNPLTFLVPILILVTLILYAFYEFRNQIDNQIFLPVAAAIAVVIYLSTLIDIRIGIAISILTIAVSPEMEVGGVGNLRFEDFIVPVLLFSWLSRASSHKEAFQPAIIGKGYLTFIIMAGFASLFGILSETISGMKPFYILGKMVEYLLIYLIILNNIRTKTDAEAFVIYTMLVTMIASAYSFTRSPIINPSESSKIMGPLGETANIFGGYMVMNTSIFLGLFLHVRTIAQKAVVMFCIIGLFYIVLLTFSRTSFSAFFAGLIIFGILKGRKLLILTILLFVIFLATAPQDVINRIRTIIDVGYFSGPAAWTSRMDSWEMYSNYVSSNNPILGHGLGSVNLGDVDNEYVKVYVDTGILGLLAFLWMLFILGRAVNKFYPLMKPEGLLTGYVAGYMIAYFALLVHCVGATPFTSIRTMEQFMIMTGLANAIINNYAEWEGLKQPDKEQEFNFRSSI